MKEKIQCQDPWWLRWLSIYLQCGRPRFDSWVGKIPWRRGRLPTPVFLGFPCGSTGKESTCNAGNLGLIPGLGRSPGEGKGYPLQYFGLENSMDYKVHGVTKSQTQLSDFHFHFHLILCHPLLLLPSIFPNIRVFMDQSLVMAKGFM